VRKIKPIKKTGYILQIIDGKKVKQWIPGSKRGQLNK